jgi:hypothetical protein
LATVRWLSAFALLAVGCFSKPTFEARNDAGPGSDSAIIDGSSIDGRAIAGCDWLGTPGLGLLAYLPFDEGSGSMANDLSPLANHGTLSNATWTAGRVNGGVNITGNQYVDLGSAASLDNIGALTVCAWINLNQMTAGAATIADKSANGYVNGWNMYVQQNPNQPLGFLTSAGQSVYGSQPITAGVWTHVCTSWTGTPGTVGIDLYVNGARVNSIIGLDTQPQNSSDASNNLLLGRASGLDDFHLDGKLDEFVLFDRVLSGAEIQILYGCAN